MRRRMITVLRAAAAVGPADAVGLPGPLSGMRPPGRCSRERDTGRGGRADFRLAAAIRSPLRCAYPVG